MSYPPGKLTWQWTIHHLKMYLLAMFREYIWIIARIPINPPGFYAFVHCSGCIILNFHNPSGAPMKMEYKHDSPWSRFEANGGKYIYPMKHLFMNLKLVWGMVVNLEVWSSPDWFNLIFSTKSPTSPGLFAKRDLPKGSGYVCVSRTSRNLLTDESR